MEPSYKQTSYKFNKQQTSKLTNDPVYIKYTKWLKDNGVLVDHRLIYPAYFGTKQDGVVGVAVSEKIPAKCAVIAVPYHLLITPEKVQNDQQIRQIFQQNPELSEGGKKQYLTTLYLFMYLCKQILKQKQSFYAPYFDICQGTYLTNWTHWNIISIQNKQAQQSLKKQSQKWLKYASQFIKVFEKYKQQFKFQNLSNTQQQYKEVLNKAFSIIFARSFGRPFNSAFIIPMADSLNHNNYDYVTHMLINIQCQLSIIDNKQIRLSQQCMYRPKYTKYDLSLFKKIDQKITKTKPQIKKLQNRKQKFIKKHIKYLQNAQYQDKYWYILWQQYNRTNPNKDGTDEHKKLCQLNFFESSCEEQGDDDGTNSDEEQKFMDKYYKLQEKEEDELYMGINQSNKIKQLIFYWKIYTNFKLMHLLEEDEGYGYQRSSNLEQSHSCQGQKQINLIQQNSKQQHSSSVIQQQQHQKQPQIQKQQQQQCNEQQNQHNSSATDIQQSEQDETYEWLHNNSQKIDHKHTYFMMTTCNQHNQYTQLYNFYGRRSNKFLLAYYNFVLENNKYNSFTFRINIDNWMSCSEIPFGKKALQRTIYGFINKDSKNIFGNRNEEADTQVQQLYSKNIKIKQRRLCIDLINHCRAMLIGWQNPTQILKQCKEQGKQTPKIRITIPFSKNFQLKVLNLAKNYLTILKNSYITSLQQDKLSLLNNTYKYEQKLALRFKIQYKEILSQQFLLLEMCKEYLLKWQHGRIEISSQKQMHLVKKISKYLISLEKGKI